MTDEGATAQTGQPLSLTEIGNRSLFSLLQCKRLGVELLSITIPSVLQTGDSIIIPLAENTPCKRETM
jgi:hypothetical protein